MRRPHVMPGNLWPGRMALSSRKLSALDLYSSELMNFDEGGTFNPIEPIVIGGAGMELGSASEVLGGVTTNPKYGSTDPRIELVDQWPVHAARTITKTISWANCDGFGAQPVYFNESGAVYQTGLAASSGLNIGMIVDGHRLHDGATLVTATFSYRYNGSKPTAIPGGNESVGIARYDRTTDASTALHSAGTAGGIVYSSVFARRDVSTVEDFFAGGNVINLVFTPNQNNVIAKASYYYGFSLQTSIETEALGVKLEFSVPDQRHE